MLKLHMKKNVGDPRYKKDRLEMFAIHVINCNDWGNITARA